MYIIERYSSSEFEVFYSCRKVFLDLLVEKTLFIHGMESLEQAVSSFLHVCFVANLEFPVGSGILCTFLQRWVGKLDEHGTTAKNRKDLASAKDKVGRSFQKAFDDYAKKVFVLTTGRKSDQASSHAINKLSL
jgi:hypothetical protein